MRYAKESPKAEMVDISSVKKPSGGARYAASSNGKHQGSDGDKKKKIIIIASIAVAAVAALGVVGFGVFNAIQSQNKPVESDVPKEFTFAANTKVSGIDISSKNMKEAKALLENSKKSFITPLKLSVEVADATVELTQDNFEYTFNIDQVLQQIKADAESESGSKKDYTVTATVTDDSVKKQANAICEEYNADAVNAYVTKFHPYADNRFEYAEAVDGRKVDGEDLLAQMKGSFTGGQNYTTIKAKTEATKAEVSVDFLKKNIKKLSTYETYSNNTENGTSNMKVSLEACNGSIIDPGEQWSFNECTGDSNLESNGYKSANVISEGKVIQGIGGGICQSSSTIYNAAIRSNMKIVERYNHQWASYYVPTGLDATIDYPNLDLVLENTSGYQMFLECKLVDYTLYATFWGYQSPDYDEITVANQLGDTGGSTYSVSAWRIYYKGGKKVGEEDLPGSTYDSDQGVSFYSAEGDPGVVTTNVDNLTDTSTNNNNNSNETYNEPAQEVYTEAPVVYEPDPVVTEAPEIPQIVTETPYYEEPQQPDNAAP